VTAPRQRSKRSRAQPSFVQAAAADRRNFRSVPLLRLGDLGAAALSPATRRRFARRLLSLLEPIIANYLDSSHAQKLQRGSATRGLHRVERVETGSLADGADGEADARGRRRR